jgi:hypothetical protein
VAKTVSGFNVSGYADTFVVHSTEEEKELKKINPAAIIRNHPLPVFEYASSPPIRHGSGYNLLFFGFVRPYKG